MTVNSLNSLLDKIKDLALGEERHRGEVKAGLIMIAFAVMAFCILATPASQDNNWSYITGPLVALALFANIVGTIELSRGDPSELEQGAKKVNRRLLFYFSVISLFVLILAPSPWILYWITLYLVIIQSQVAIFLENKSITLLFFVMLFYVSVMVVIAFLVQSFVYIQILVVMLSSLSFEYVRRQSIASSTQNHNSEESDRTQSTANFLFKLKATSQLIGSWAQILIYISFLVFVVSISGIDLVGDKVVNRGPNKKCEYIFLGMPKDSCLSLTKKTIDSGQERLLDTALNVYMKMIDIKIFVITLLVGLAAIKSQASQPVRNRIRKKWLEKVMTFLWLYLVTISVLLLGFLLYEQIDFELLHQPFDEEVIIYQLGSVLTHMMFEFSVLSILPELLYFYTLTVVASYLEEVEVRNSEESEKSQPSQSS